MPHIDSIMNLILDLDESETLDVLDAARAHLSDLKNNAARDFMADAKIGDKVRIKLDAPLKPRYILGAEGTLIEKRISKVTLQMDTDIIDPYGKWAGKRAVVPASAVEKVN